MKKKSRHKQKKTKSKGKKERRVVNRSREESIDPQKTEAKIFQPSIHPEKEVFSWAPPLFHEKNLYAASSRARVTGRRIRFFYNDNQYNTKRIFYGTSYPCGCNFVYFMYQLGVLEDQQANLCRRHMGFPMELLQKILFEELLDHAALYAKLLDLLPIVNQEMTHLIDVLILLEKNYREMGSAISLSGFPQDFQNEKHL